MTDVYVVRNQLGHYWGKAKEWVDGREPKTVMRVKHEDEAINTLFELSSKDIDLRGEVMAVALTERGDPVVEASEHLILKESEIADTAADDAPASDNEEPDEEAPAEARLASEAHS